MTKGEREEAEQLVRRMLELIGDDPTRPGVLETPKRVVKSWGELFSGYREDPQVHAKVFESEYDQIVAISGIDYFSMCEHHMLPFYGKCYVAYLPDESRKVLGVSKFARIIDVYSRRLQIQEQLTQQIAVAIQEAIEPKGVAVVVDGVHLCMMARGVKQQHAEMSTSCMLGVFRDNAAAQTCDWHAVNLLRPFVRMDKGGIVGEGIRLGVPYELTWTCYNGGQVACGKCGSCQERLEAFKFNNVDDPLRYA